MGRIESRECGFDCLLGKKIQNNTFQCRGIDNTAPR